MKRIALSIATLVLLVPVVAPALTADEIRLQIQNLLSQVEQLRQQLTSLQEQGDVVLPTYNTTIPANCRVWYDGCNTCTRSAEGSDLACTQRYCVWNAPSKCEAYFGEGNTGTPRICSLPFVRSLTQGERGDTVVALQDFLKKEGYFNEESTGFFGSLTEGALQKWQSTRGVVSYGSPGVTGWGVMGPRTWQAIRERCQPVQDPAPKERFSATPQKGDAPLTVTFSTLVSGFHSQNISYIIDYGDGTSAPATPCSAPADACVSPGVNTHTYTSEGAYTATLSKVTDLCQGNPQCAAPVQNEVLGKALIVVGSRPGACTKEYAPVCGRPSGCANSCPEGAYCAMLCQIPEPRTYGNSCLLKNEGAELLYKGVCTQGTVDNKPPTISKFSGPTALSVGGTGMWSIVASDPENKTLSYSITWGDEYLQSADSAVSAAQRFSQSTTFTHTYMRAGTYTIIVTVTDSDGASAEVSGTVSVGKVEPVACTLEYLPVCAIPSFCLISKFAEGSYPSECQHGKTYGNKCAMSADNAVFKYQGECTFSAQ